MSRAPGIVFLAAAAMLGGCGGEEKAQPVSPERAPDAQERAMLNDAASMLDESAAAATPPAATAPPDESAR